MATKKAPQKSKKDMYDEEDTFVADEFQEEEPAEIDIDEVPPDKLEELEHEIEVEDLAAPEAIEELVAQDTSDDLPQAAPPVSDLDTVDETEAENEEGVSPLPKNTVVICPSCQEEVVVVSDKQICPLCGNPLGSPDELQKDTTVESEGLDEGYFLTTDEDIDYADKTNPLTDPDVDIFDNLPFHEDKF